MLNQELNKLRVQHQKTLDRVTSVNIICLVLNTQGVQHSVILLTKCMIQIKVTEHQTSHQIHSNDLENKIFTKK